ncbi:Protein of unknown function DUF285 [uncultured Caudovirales phage]|uniref:Bacterial surface protein 26-residue repeat n=1 Tax=uncultured Caudovirales phage TaxID=2100421 RepID=A0A6J5NAQ5_9CAUD|nr:Protein of unknown function DUF285 [uncultured Caudovirales phage]
MSASFGSSRVGTSRSPATNNFPLQPQRPLPSRTTADTYTRPADWAAMPTVTTGDKKIVILAAVWNLTSNFIAFNVSGSLGYTVDWGDGTSPVNVATGVQAQYNYTYSTVPGSVTTRGYKTAVITITPQSTGTLTSVNFNLEHTSLNGSSVITTTPILELIICSAALTSFTLGSGSPVVATRYLEKVNMIDLGTITSATSWFNGCQSLQSVAFPAAFSTSLTDCSSMFQSCSALQTVPLFNTVAVTNMNNMFQDCRSLVFVPDFNTAAVTNGMGGMFQNCFNLTYAPNFNTANCNNFGSMFQQCFSLVSVPAYNLSSSSNGVGSMFQSCRSLKTVPAFRLRTAGTYNASSMFNGCSSLLALPPMDWSFCNSMANTFQNCASLIAVPNLVLTNCTSLSSTFSDCRALRTVGNITVTSACTNMIGTFNGAYSIISLGAITGTTGVTSVNNLFGNMHQIKVFPNMAFPACTNFNAMFNSCMSMTTAPAITFGGAVTTTENMFLNCQALVTVPDYTITFAASATMATTFSGCNSLLAGPTWNTANVNNMTSMFASCFNLRSVPAYNTTNVINMTSMFNTCVMLQSLPTFTTSAVTNFTTTFSDCRSLKYIDSWNFTGGTTLTNAFGSAAASNCGMLSRIIGTNNFKVSVNLSNAMLSGTQLDEIYTGLATITAQTITVTGNWGTATDTPSIATAKGWTVTGT